MEPNMTRIRRPADRGAGMVECVLLVALIAFVAIPAIVPVQIGIKRTLCRVMKQQWDVSEYFVEATGQCKKDSSPVSDVYW